MRVVFIFKHENHDGAEMLTDEVKVCHIQRLPSSLSDVLSEVALKL